MTDSNYAKKIKTYDRDKAKAAKTALVEKLTEIRASKGFRVRLAEALDVDPSTIKRMEDNDFALDMETFFLWCYALKVDPIVTFVQSQSKQ